MGPERVDKGCIGAMEHEAIDVGLIGRMLERATEDQDAPATAATATAVVGGRFSGDPGEFATARPAAAGGER